MQLPSLILPSSTTPPTSMEANQLFASESFSYSLRLSFDAESFIEFDPKLLSMRWSIQAQEEGVPDSCLDLDLFLLSSNSTKSLLSHSVPVITPCTVQGKQNGTVLTHNRFRPSLKKYLWFVLMKICRRIGGGKKSSARNARKSSAKGVSVERGRGRKVFDVDSESCIHDAVLHCKNSNSSSLMDAECK